MATTKGMLGCLLVGWIVFVNGPSARARDREAEIEFFELRIRPLLTEKCASCHTGDVDAESALAVDSRSALTKGGDFGPAILPGRAGDSVLIQAVKWTHKVLRMPPDSDDRLSKDEIAALVRWIDQGAIWPRSSQTNEVVRRSSKIGGQRLETDHWSFQPRKVVPPPEASGPRWSGNGIDRFLEDARRRKRLTAVSEADRRTLIRRVTFDLIGLPPTPVEVESFVTDPRATDEAYADVIDRLLASPHYGERWGRHWLDVARYADTQGDVGDIPIPKAYLYRNWVINSLNADLPFDEFLRAQIAGDVLAAEAWESGAIDDERARQLVVATGFLALAQRYGNSKAEHLHLTIENTIDTLGRGVLGLTLRCSRCHDHPFDPVLQTDYYGLYGILESTTYPSMGMSVEKSPSDLAPAIPDRALQSQAAAHWDTISRYEYQINNHHRPWLKPTLDEFKNIDSSWKSSTDGSTGHQQLTARRDALLSRYNGEFRELMLHGLAWLRTEKQRLAETPPFEMVFAVSEGTAHDAHLQPRGEPTRPGPVVPRRFLQVLDGPEAPSIETGSGRRELAAWLTRPDHPLIPRVVVNRIWQRHFGRGLVATSDNLGVRGERPSHPQLLDWLVEQFIQDGWSLKELHRRIVLTQTYRLSSDGGSNARQEQRDDPANIYLWRFRRRRLEAEAIRDAMLAVSGSLDPTPGRAHPFSPWHTQRYGLNKPFHTEYETNRRSVYVMTQRLFDHSFLGLFDAPDANSTTTRRASADVVGQALFLMNSPFIHQQSQTLADRLLTDLQTDDQRIQQLFKLAYGRAPQDVEQGSVAKYIERFPETLTSNLEDAAMDRRIWTSIARAVLTSNEFFFVD